MEERGTGKQRKSAPPSYTCNEGAGPHTNPSKVGSGGGQSADPVGVCEGFCEFWLASPPAGGFPAPTRKSIHIYIAPKGSPFPLIPSPGPGGVEEISLCL